MATPRAVEKGRLVDHVRAGGHCRGCFGGRGPELVAAVLDGTIQLDDDRDSAIRLEVVEETSLVLESSLADDVELRVVPHGPVDELGRGRTFHRVSMLAASKNS